MYKISDLKEIENYFLSVQEKVEEKLDNPDLDIDMSKLERGLTIIIIKSLYKNEEIIELLKNAGFDYIKTYGDFKLEAPKQDSERVFFVCKK